jgi:hypothetical protein
MYDEDADFRKIKSHAVKAVFGVIFLSLGIFLIGISFVILRDKPEMKLQSLEALGLGGFTSLAGLIMLLWTYFAWKSGRLRTAQLEILNRHFDEIVDKLEEFEEKKENPLPYLFEKGITDALLLRYIIKYKKGQPRTFGFGAPEY